MYIPVNASCHSYVPSGDQTSRSSREQPASRDESIQCYFPNETFEHIHNSPGLQPQFYFHICPTLAQPSMPAPAPTPQPSNPPAAQAAGLLPLGPAAAGVLPLPPLPPDVVNAEPNRSQDTGCCSFWTRMSRTSKSYVCYGFALCVFAVAIITIAVVPTVLNKKLK